MAAKLDVVIGCVPTCTDLSGPIGHTGKFGWRICPVKAIIYKEVTTYHKQASLQEL